MGRLITFLARAAFEGWAKEPVGIGVEETKIRDEMLFVVLGDLIRPGNLVGYDRVHLGLSVVRIFGPVDDLI